jgi:hypothetical protein
MGQRKNSCFVKFVKDFEEDGRPEEPDDLNEGTPKNSDIHGNLFGLPVKGKVRYEPGHPLHVFDISLAVDLNHLALLVYDDKPIMHEKDDSEKDEHPYVLRIKPDSRGPQKTEKVERVAHGGIRTGVDKGVSLIPRDKKRGPDPSENAEADEKDAG